MSSIAFHRQSGPRKVLAITALAGLLGPNGWFLRMAARDFPAFLAALQQPVPLTLMIEAVFLTALGAWVLHRTGARPGWRCFVLMSLGGGLAFSVPAWLWLAGRRVDRTARA